MQIADFLIQQCQDRRISLRGLSLNAGLSPGTVHNIIRGRYSPSVATLNALADYLGVKKEYLWQMAGLLDNLDRGIANYTFSDPQLELLCAQVNQMPRDKRETLISVIKALIASLRTDTK